MKKVILLGLVVSAVAAYAYGSNTRSGMRFGAPTVSDAASVFAPEQGDIVFEASSATNGDFLGYDGNQWVDLTPSTTTASYVSSESNELTPSGNGWQDLAGTDHITLTPGTWLVHGTVHFGTSGTAGISNATACISSSSGSTCTIPTAVQAGKATGVISTTSGVLADTDILAGPVRITTDSNLDIYVTPYLTATTPGNARIIGYLYAEKVR